MLSNWAMIKRTFGLLRRNWVLAMGGSCVSTALGLVDLLLMMCYYDYVLEAGAALTWWGVLALVAIMAFMLFSSGALSYGQAVVYLDMVRSERGRFSGYFSGVGLALSLGLFMLVVGVGVTLGTVLLVVPGVLFYLFYGQVFYVATEQAELGLKAAMRQSAALTKGRRLKLFWIQLFLIIFALLLFVPIGILSHYLINRFALEPLWSNVISMTLSFFVMPYFSMLFALFYDELRGSSRHDEAVE